MVRKPTAKQAKFAALVIEGYSLADAYRKSYDAEAMSEASVRVAACKLAKHPNIALMIENGKREAMSNAIWNRAKAIQQLETVNEKLFDAINQGDITPATLKSFLQVTEQLNGLIDIPFELNTRREVFKAARDDRFGMSQGDLEAGLEAIRAYDDALMPNPEA